MWSVIAILLTLTAILAYLNQRWIGLPPSVGMMVGALLFSLLLLILQSIGVELAGPMRQLLDRVRFDTTLLHGLLGFLLFAGALSVDLVELRRNGWVIASLATFGVVISTLLGGLGTYWVMRWLGEALPWQYCLLFGALISPTDPIAVLALLKRMRVPKHLETQVAGESLFNDGVAVTLFLLAFSLVADGPAPTLLGVGMALTREILGGIVFGLLTGWLVARLLHRVDQYTVEILLTLALVSGGFALADSLAVSAPLAIVSAGLMIGSHGRNGMSEVTRHHLDLFWHLLDEILNAVLFVLLGLEILVMHYQQRYLGMIVLLLPVVLLARLASVGIPFVLLRKRARLSKRGLGLMVWGGLHGGLSVAMALSLPVGPQRDLLVAATYGVVVLGLIVQGGSLGMLMRWQGVERTQPEP